MAQQSVSDVVQSIITQLKALDPSISAEVGTPERKIIEAVAEQIAAASVDLNILSSQHDVDSLTGSSLDSFLANFGFGRQSATRAVGSVTFSRNSPASADVTIAIGTTVQSKITTDGLPALVYSTTQTVVIPQGGTTVDARVACNTYGSIGNLPPNSIVGFASQGGIGGITSVTNASAFSGGADSESDDELRIRFKNTAFRNISGTTDQYLALAVTSPYVTKANVVGPMSRYQEYVQVPSGVIGTSRGLGGGDDVNQATIYDPSSAFPNKRTTAVSSIPYSKFTYDTGYYLTDGDTGPGATYFRPNVDFVFNNPRFPDGDATGDANGINNCTPNITILQPNVNGPIKPGDVLFLEHSYISKSSRNDYITKILNCVDIFVDGQFPVAVSSSEIMPGSGSAIVSSPSTTFTYRFNYRRKVDGAVPAAGNVLQVLFWQPVTDIPDSITIGSNKYLKANFYNPNDGNYYNSFDPTTNTYKDQAHYWHVEDTTDLFGTVRARNGIEWSSTLVGQLADASINGNAVPVTATSQSGTQFAIGGYYYDQNVASLQATMDSHKQVTSDVLVHGAKFRYFRLYLTIMYTSGSNPQAVNFQIAQSVGNFFRSLYFGSAVQLSDILQVVHNTIGVDNVRWTNEVNSLTPKVEEVAKQGTSFRKSTTLSINGTPTGGTYTLTYGSSSTTALAYNANASTIEIALSGIAAIGQNVQVLATSGTTFNITLTAAGLNNELLTATSSLTGGTSPNVSLLPSVDAFQSKAIYNSDFFLQDNELAAIPDINNNDTSQALVIKKKAQSTWNLA